MAVKTIYCSFKKFKWNLKLWDLNKLLVWDQTWTVLYNFMILTWFSQQNRHVVIAQLYALNPLETTTQSILSR